MADKTINENPATEKETTVVNNARTENKPTLDDIDVESLLSETQPDGLFEKLDETDKKDIVEATGFEIIDSEDVVEEEEEHADESTFITNETSNTTPPETIIDAEFEDRDSEIIDGTENDIDENADNTQRDNKNDKSDEELKQDDNNKETGDSDKGTISGTLTPEEIKSKLKGANAEHYYAVHQGDKFEQALAEKMNEFEQRKIEAEAKINMLYGKRRELRDKINGRGFWQKAVNFALVKPVRGLWRLFQKVIGRGNKIRYSPEEIELQAVKQKIKEEKERIIYIDKEQKDYVKAMQIDIQKDAPIITPPTQTKETNETKEPIEQNNNKNQPNKDQDNVEKNTDDKPIDNENKNTETKSQNATREPNATKIFEQMMQKVYGADAFAAHGSKAGIIVDITDKAGNMHKFSFNQHKGELTPQSFGVEGGLDKAIVNQLAKEAYITYTLAAAKTGKPLVNEQYVQNTVSPKVEKMLSGETKYANFNLGCIPISIAAQENGTYAIKFNYDKNNKTQDLTIFTDASQLKGDKLASTIASLRASYAMTMYKSMVSEKFIDFMKDSRVVKNLHKAKLNNFEKHNNTIKFNVVLQENKDAQPTVIPAVFTTNNFEVHVADEHINMLNGNQKIALTEAVRAVERGYSSFILTNCHIMPETVLPAPLDVMQEMNDNISSVKEGEEKNFYAYGIIFNVNKKDNEYPVVTVSGKDGIVMNKEPLYNGKMDENSIMNIYNGIATSITMEAEAYDKQEAAHMNHESKKGKSSVADIVLSDDGIGNDGGMSQGDISAMINDAIEASQPEPDR